MADVPSNVDPATKSFLGKEMYLVVTRPVRSPEIAKRLGDHLAHQIELEKRGIMFGRTALSPRLRNSRSRDVPAARKLVRGSRGHRQGRPAAQGRAAYLHVAEMAGQRGPHHRHRRFLRSDHEDRMSNHDGAW